MVIPQLCGIDDIQTRGAISSSILGSDTVPTHEALDWDICDAIVGTAHGFTEENALCLNLYMFYVILLGTVDTKFRDGNLLVL